MTVLVQIQVISMNRLCQGDSAIAKQWLQCLHLGRSDRMANKGTVKAKSRQLCIKLSFSSVALCDVNVLKILNQSLE